MFSAVDIKSAFNNVPVTERAKRVMGVVTKGGLFRFKRLTMGVTDGPFAFQHVVDSVLSGAPGARAFMDDIKVQGEHWKQTWDRTMETLRRLVGAGFLINLRKTKLLVVEFVLLGLMVSNKSM